MNIFREHERIAGAIAGGDLKEARKASESNLI